MQADRDVTARCQSSQVPVDFDEVAGHQAHAISPPTPWQLQRQNTDEIGAARLCWPRPRPSGLPSIADIMLHCREPPQWAITGRHGTYQRRGSWDSLGVAKGAHQ
jgi:hypothetical protein